MDLGDRFLSTTFYTKFTTVNASGVPTTLGNSPTLEFYVGAGATAFTVGLSLDVDFNSRTGMNMVTVIATSSATAWTSGIDVQVVVATGSVSGVSLKSYKVCEFSLQNRAGLRPTVQGRNLVVDAAGLADANTVKVGPTGSGATQTARDIGASVLLSSGTGTGQLVLAAGLVEQTQASADKAWATAARILTAGTNIVLAKGVGITGFNDIAATAIVSGGAITTSGGAVSLVTTTTTATNLTNAPTAGDFTATMKTSLNASTPDSVTTVTGNVNGSVGSVTGAVGSVTGAVGSVTAPVTVGTNSDKTGYVLSATGSAALTEDYAADGATFTLNQGLYMIWSLLAERSIASTTLTAGKLDASAAMTFTLDSATTPNSQTRAT